MKVKNRMSSIRRKRHSANSSTAQTASRSHGASESHCQRRGADPGREASLDID